jgi:hypothetical protein
MRLCLNMIVKNEAARIERCLAAVLPWISDYAILDTGSTDDTVERIKRTLSGIPGSIQHRPFENFSVTRNHALALGRESSSDYLLLVDADMELRVDDQTWRDALTAPAYKLIQKNGNLSYGNIRLLRRDADAHYVGATHEYLAVEGGEPPNLTGAWFIDHADGANRPGKFERDAALLTGEIATTARSWFYLAQSKRDQGDKRSAAEAYKVRAELGGWDQEVWRSMLERARALRDVGDASWVGEMLASWQRRIGRVEPLYDLAHHYREAGMNEVSLLFSRRGLDFVAPPENDVLFIETAPYEYGMREEFSICAYNTVEHARGREVCNALALDRSVPQLVRDTARRNLFWYAQSLAEWCPSFSDE